MEAGGITCVSGANDMCSLTWDQAFEESGFHYFEWHDKDQINTGSVEFVMYCLFGDCPHGYYIQDPKLRIANQPVLVTNIRS